MMKIIFALLFFISFSVYAAEKNDRYNNYIDYANSVTEHVTSIFTSLKDSYDYGFTCPAAQSEYYFKKSVESDTSHLSQQAKQLREMEDAVDKKCKTMEGNKDHKKMESFRLLMIELRKKQNTFISSVETEHQKSLSTLPNTLIYKISMLMREHIKKEKEFLEGLSFNLAQDIRTTFPDQKIQNRILATILFLKKLPESDPSIKYPENVTYAEFKKNIAKMLETKRGILDGYNHEAQESDRYRNEQYLRMVDEFNGYLIPFYNNFVSSFQGLKLVKYAPTFEINKNATALKIVAKPFQDIPYLAINVKPEPDPIPKELVSALNDHVEFVNYALKETVPLKNSLGDLMAAIRKYYTDSAQIKFHYPKFKMPVSLYQKITIENTAIPAAYTQSLVQQTQVLFNVLEEITQLTRVLDREIREERYKKDNFGYANILLHRYNTLFDNFDAKKERLNKDLQLIYDAYSPGQATNPWSVSAKELQELLKASRESLSAAKTYYRKWSTQPVSTKKLDQIAQQLTLQKSKNMQGIQAFEEPDGSSPQKTYDNMIANAQKLSQEIKELQPIKKVTGATVFHSYPYNRLVLTYKAIIDDYNQFVVFSMDTPILKKMYQSELFLVIHPERLLPED
jgi:Ca-activated chloride channel family protein